MKYVVLLLFIISFSCCAMDGLYQLPSGKTITERLKKAKLENFASNSKIAEAIGDRFFKPIHLHQYVKIQVEKYNNSTREWKHQDFRVKHQQPTVSIVMTLLLRDYPSALIALEKNYDGAFLR